MQLRTGFQLKTIVSTLHMRSRMSTYESSNIARLTQKFPEIPGYSKWKANNFCIWSLHVSSSLYFSFNTPTNAEAYVNRMRIIYHINLVSMLWFVHMSQWPFSGPWCCRLGRTHLVITHLTPYHDCKSSKLRKGAVWDFAREPRARLKHKDVQSLR